MYSERVIITPESFAHFKKQSITLVSPPHHVLALLHQEGMASSMSVIKNNIIIDFFIQQLYFVTRIGNSALESVPSKAVHWLLSKLSTENIFDNTLSNDIAVEELRMRVLERCPCTLSTAELLNMYSDNNMVNQLFVVNSKAHASSSGGR